MSKTNKQLRDYDKQRGNNRKRSSDKREAKDAISKMRRAKKEYQNLPCDDWDEQL